jgi:hypothetical protein
MRQIIQKRVVNLMCRKGIQVQMHLPSDEHDDYGVHTSPSARTYYETELRLLSQTVED